ncbi:MAG TPA: response regulator [Chloroflexota bacterium]|nr:response regulator [Chloroflexota bacterium]
MRPDLITLDLSLPGLDGRDVPRALKSETETRHIPAVIISAHAAQLKPEERQLAAAALHKPFDVDEVLDVIQRSLGDA